MGAVRLRLQRVAIAALAAIGIASIGCSSGIPRIADPPSFRALRAFIEEQHVDSVDRVVAALPSRYRERYALVFDSRSLQRATFEQPRAILFGKDDSLIVTFDGANSEGGDAALETLEFDSRQRRLVFREITFRTTNGKSRVEFSEGNPTMCAACHGVQPHPIWDTYPMWPGVYGETEGIAPTAAPRERQGYAAFEAQRVSRAGYRWLTETPPNRAQLDELAYHGATRRSANAELGTLLRSWNAASVIADILSSSRYAAHERDLAGSLIGACGGADEDPRFATFLASLRQGEQGSSESATRRAADATPFVRHTMPLSLARFRFLASTTLGISSDRWGLGTARDAFDFPLSESVFVDQFLAQAIEHDPGLAGAIQAARYNGDCAALRARQAPPALRAVR